MIALMLASLLAVTPNANVLDRATSNYSKAAGIQWTMKSATYSPIFDETENSSAEFDYNPPDTFYFMSGDEETIGIADTVWTLSKKHHQIQKRLSGDFPMPTDYVLNWKARYDLVGDTSLTDAREFVLKAHKGVTPLQIKLRIDKNNSLKSLYYQDASGNDVTLSIIKERLARIKNIKLFYQNVHTGFKLIDLTQ